MKIEEENKESSQGSDNSWFSSWSGLTTTFDSPKSKTREFRDDNEEEDQGWSSFCSKGRNESKSKSDSFFSSQASASSQATNIPIQTWVDKNNNKDNNEDDDDDSKVEFFLKVGKHIKFKFF